MAPMSNMMPEVMRRGCSMHNTFGALRRSVLKIEGLSARDKLIYAKATAVSKLAHNCCAWTRLTPPPLVLVLVLLAAVGRRRGIVPLGGRRRLRY